MTAGDFGPEFDRLPGCSRLGFFVIPGLAKWPRVLRLREG